MCSDDGHATPSGVCMHAEAALLAAALTWLMTQKKSTGWRRTTELCVVPICAWRAWRCSDGGSGGSASHLLIDCSSSMFISHAILPLRRPVRPAAQRGCRARPREINTTKRNEMVQLDD